MTAILTNTLRFNPELCINCGMCSIVCPHRVFKAGNKTPSLISQEACMECGACQKNCPTSTITVESGVGCASAIMLSALFGKKEIACSRTCGKEDKSE